MVVSPSPNPETVGALLDTTWRMMDAEGVRTDALDRKAATLATFASLVLSVTATLGGEFLDAFRSWIFIPFLFSLLAFIGAAVLAVRVLLPKEHVTLGMDYLKRFPKWSEILKPPEQVRGETMYGLIEALAEERAISLVKVRGVRWGYRLLLVGLTCLVIQASTLGFREFL